MLKRLAGLTLAIALTGTLGVTATAHAAEGKRVYNGLQITFRTDTPELFCTLGAVGTDDHQRHIAISAGHCLEPDKKYSDREIPENVQPVYDRNDIGFGPIGHVRYYKDPEGSQTGHPTKDYMVIELVPQVTLSSQGPYLKQTGEVKSPQGPVSPNALNPALDTERLLTTGDNEIITSGQSGVWYGTVLSNDNGIYQAPAPHVPRDSGGPVIWHVPGTDLPSTDNNFQAAGPWAGITKAITIEWPPFNYTSSANILADLRAREAKDPAHNIFGAGFQVTNNP
ncbi:hypothetical protein [Streptomyces orinoci]|uniref:Peptidase S1 domain-containing protein n=1 Tax=Streptomyces orinoci TaxID=67339 RepID=A0ABV3K185_STRON|nr:hypothetical protein [Streptomyces orinoci]